MFLLFLFSSLSSTHSFVASSCFWCLHSLRVVAQLGTDSAVFVTLLISFVQDSAPQKALDDFLGSSIHLLPIAPNDVDDDVNPHSFELRIYTPKLKPSLHTEGLSQSHTMWIVESLLFLGGLSFAIGEASSSVPGESLDDLCQKGILSNEVLECAISCWENTKYVSRCLNDLACLCNDAGYQNVRSDLLGRARRFGYLMAQEPRTSANTH